MGPTDCFSLRWACPEVFNSSFACLSLINTSRIFYVDRVKYLTLVNRAVLERREQIIATQFLKLKFNSSLYLYLILMFVYSFSSAIEKKQLKKVGIHVKKIST